MQSQVNFILEDTKSTPFANMSYHTYLFVSHRYLEFLQQTVPLFVIEHAILVCALRFADPSKSVQSTRT